MKGAGVFPGLVMPVDTGDLQGMPHSGHRTPSRGPGPEVEPLEGAYSGPWTQGPGAHGAPSGGPRAEGGPQEGAHSGPGTQELGGRGNLSVGLGQKGDLQRGLTVDQGHEDLKDYLKK